jgi:hypothetical protein
MRRSQRRYRHRRPHGGRSRADEHRSLIHRGRPATSSGDSSSARSIRACVEATESPIKEQLRSLPGSPVINPLTDSNDDKNGNSHGQAEAQLASHPRCEAPAVAVARPRLRNGSSTSTSGAAEPLAGHLRAISWPGRGHRSCPYRPRRCRARSGPDGRSRRQWPDQPRMTRAGR